MQYFHVVVFAEKPLQGNGLTVVFPPLDMVKTAGLLALAQEFHAIGDTEGARALVKEVIAESSGSMRARAERFLAELS